MDQRIDKLEFEGVDKELHGEMQGALNSTIDILSKRDDALKAMVVALRAEVAQLKEKLRACRMVNGGIPTFLPTPKWEVPKPKTFSRSRDAREIDNFLWGLEQ